MKSLLQPSIGRRLIVAVVLACGLVWTAIYYFGRLGVYAPEVGNFDREMLLRARAAKQLADEAPDARTLAIALTGLTAQIEADGKVHGTPGDFVAYRVLDGSGALVGAGGVGPQRWPVMDERLGLFEHADAGLTYQMHRAIAGDGKYRVEMASSHRSRDYVFDEVMFSADGLLPLLYGFPLLLLPVWFAVRTGLSPLNRLSSELAARRPDDLSPLQVSGVYRELSPLVGELNAAFGRIGALRSRERAFLADAAHELRTPLAVMIAQCDNLRRAPTGAAREAALHRLDRGLARASRLVHQLLALARLEAEVDDKPALIDVADLIRDGLALHAGAAYEQGIDLGYLGPDHLALRLPAQCLESVVDNLVGNAVRYGRRGGHVEVALEYGPGERVQLCVRDDGPGIALQEQRQVFERFKRGAAATATGSGLGLSIVKSAARQMNADIALGPGLEGRGVEIKLTWPNDGGD